MDQEARSLIELLRDETQSRSVFERCNAVLAAADAPRLNIAPSAFLDESLHAAEYVSTTNHRHRGRGRDHHGGEAVRLKGIPVKGVVIKDGKMEKRKSYANVSQKLRAASSKKVRVKRKV